LIDILAVPWFFSEPVRKSRLVTPPTPPRAREATPKPSPIPPPKAKNERYDPAAIMGALTASHGMIRAAARMIGCDKDTILDMAKRRPEVQAVIENERELQKDMTELALFKAINAGDVKAIAFYLRCQARDRGYIEKSDVVLSGGITLEQIMARSFDLQAEPVSQTLQGQA
jgi:hypothetical protein